MLIIGCVVVFLAARVNADVNADLLLEAAAGDTTRGADATKPVAWVEGAAWHDARVALDLARAPPLGCCPAAVAVYGSRYAGVEFRCCSHRLDGIRKLRPVGGVTWAEYLLAAAENNSTSSSVLLTGDSLSEQHFVALLCLAWAEGIAVDGPRSVAHYGIFDDWGAVVADRVEVTFLRGDKISPKPIIEGQKYASPNHVILGGWHHGGTQNLPAFFAAVSNVRRGKSTLVVEALPNHFPDGDFRSKSSVVSRINGAVCNDVSSDQGGDPNVNAGLPAMLRNLSGFQLLRVEHLYAHRGEAHVGPIPASITIGPQGRDCLHWCVAPGVLDALAQVTLAHVVLSL